MTAEVLDRNTCANCRRPIAKLAGIGWVHGELPQYAHDPVSCGVPSPVDPHCDVCGQLCAASNVAEGRVRLGRHDRDGAPCPGAGAVQEFQR